MLPLIESVSKNNTQKLKFLLDHGYGTEVIDKPHHFRAIHFAAVRGNLIGLKLLLKAGARPNAQDRHGNTPLDLTEEKGFGSASEILKAYGGVPGKNLIKARLD